MWFALFIVPNKRGNNSVDVFCSRVCKERIKHNHISPTGLGRIDTHTQMHRHTHPTLEKVAIVAQMTHLIFFGSLIQDNLSKIPQTKKNVAVVSVLLGKESRTTFYRKLHKHGFLWPCQLKTKCATWSKITLKDKVLCASVDVSDICVCVHCIWKCVHSCGKCLSQCLLKQPEQEVMGYW